MNQNVCVHHNRLLFQLMLHSLYLMQILRMLEILFAMKWERGNIMVLHASVLM